jgi:hypothetical protein
MSPEVLEKIMRDVAALNEELIAAGAWVSDGGAHRRVPDHQCDRDSALERGRLVTAQAHVFSVSEVRERTVQDAFAAGAPRRPSTGHLSQASPGRYPQQQV